MAYKKLFLGLLLVGTLHVHAQGDAGSAATLICKLSTSRYPNLKLICTPLTNYLKFEKYRGEVESYLKDVQDQKPEPQLPSWTGESKTIVSFFTELETDINAVTIPTAIEISVVPMPTPELLGSPEPQVRRQAVNVLYTYAEDYTNQYKDFGLAKENFNELAQELITTRNAFRALQETYLGNVTGTSIDPLKVELIIGGAGLDIMNHINPKISAITRLLTTKNEQIASLRTVEGAKLNSFLSNALLIAQAEQDLITQKTISADSLIQASEIAIKYTTDSFNDAARKFLEKTGAEKEQLRVSLSEAESLISRYQKEEAEMKERFNQRKKSYKEMKYTSCPKGQAYENCNHLDLKREFDDEKERRHQSLKRLKDEIENQQRLIANAAKNYKNMKASTKDRIAKLDAEAKQQADAHIEQIKALHARVEEGKNAHLLLTGLLQQHQQDYGKLQALKAE